MKSLSLYFSLLLLGSGCASQNLNNQSRTTASTKYQTVTSDDGIPVYTEPYAAEENICGRLPYGSFTETQETSEFGFLKLKLATSNPKNCRENKNLYIQEGFLIGSHFAGPLTRSRVQKWKSETPSFKTRCVERDQGNKIIVSFVGDLLIHKSLQHQAVKSGFKSLWENVEPVFKNADLSYANLEGPVAENIDCRGRISDNNKTVGGDCRKDRSSVYTTYPMFNYQKELVPALKASGFDVVSTANNHVLDRYSTGADKTIEVLKKEKLLYTGSRKSGTKEPFYTITQTRDQKNGLFKIAWLACTYSANGFKDKKDQVLNCFNYSKKGRPTSKINKKVLSIIKKLKKDKSINGIIVTPHWGPTEYVHTVHPRQLKLGKKLLEAGAIAIIGAHPHVLQPWEQYTTSDGREGLIHYSLGNFVSGQKGKDRRASMILLLGFQKDKNNKLVIDGVRYVPSYMARYTWIDRRFTPLDTDKRITREGQESLDNVLSLYPEKLRLNSDKELTTCH